MDAIRNSIDPIGIVKALDNDSHVKTRIAQYKALENGKGSYIAKQLVKGLKTLINGKVLLFAKYLRNKQKEWNPES